MVRSTDGGVIATCKGRSQHHTIAEIELQGLEHELLLARRHGISKIAAQTYSCNVVDFLKIGGTPPW
ncbi:hypothetical protein FRX31_002220 [Thalictrum thalictroides]|uniref:RNase H type-1 domain-containing protein n=1 Tax=Thalictrum thalictroides TaxID=46969 RepID=A0A7J6XHG1_THATH|nr:hypothetical protein FRX31_002220 [Thalictrum thalictroides]